MLYVLTASEAGGAALLHMDLASLLLRCYKDWVKAVKTPRYVAAVQVNITFA